MLSKTALLCLESNIFLRWELFNRNSVANTPQERKQHSEYHKLKNNLRSNPQEFFDYFNMSIEVYDYIFQNIRDRLDASMVTIKTLSPGEKLFITMRYLAKGMTLKELSQAFLIGLSTASKVINETLSAVWESLHTVHMAPPVGGRVIDMKRLSSEYFNRWKFPNCIGAIGGKYIDIHRNKHKTHSTRKWKKNNLVLYAVADANFRFQAIQVIAVEDQPDYRFSGVFEHMGSRRPPGSETKLPLVLVGNEAFPLMSDLMRPYPMRAATICETKANFNKRLESARLTVDCAFEILSEKWQVYNHPLCHIEFAIMTVKVTCLLHNIIRDMDGLRDTHFSKFGLKDRGAIYLDLLTRRTKNTNRSSSSAVRIREKFADYLMEHDKV